MNAPEAPAPTPGIPWPCELCTENHGIATHYDEDTNLQVCKPCFNELRAAGAWLKKFFGDGCIRSVSDRFRKAA